MTNPHNTSHQEDSYAQEKNLSRMRDQAMKKGTTYVLLTVAAVLAVLLWVYYGAIIGLGFIFLELQFLLVISTLGLAASTLEQISRALQLLTHGDRIDYHFQKDPQTAERELSEIIEKTADSAGLKP